MKQLSGVILDFDGVVVDSLPLHLKAWDLAYQALFDRTIPPEVLASLVGRSTLAIAKLLCRLEHADHLADKLIRGKEDQMLHLSLAVPLLAGTTQLMDFLTQYNIPFGIASNSPREFLSRILHIHKLEHVLALGKEDYAHPKPSPEPFLICAKKLGISFLDHGDIVVFEDSAHGIRAAIQAGMRAVGVAAQHSNEELLAFGAEEVCKTPWDFLRTLLSS
jgi:beta-phosphoglucomutase-like phosphatase (HAD superfamily)